MYVRVCVYVCICGWMHESMHVCMRARMHVCVHVRMHVCLLVCVRAHNEILLGALVGPASVPDRNIHVSK